MKLKMKKATEVPMEARRYDGEAVKKGLIEVKKCWNEA